MASLSGLLQRPLSTVAVIAVAAASTDIPDRLSSRRKPDLASKDTPATTGLSFWTPSAKLCTNGSSCVENLDSFRILSVPVASIPVIQSVYQYARITTPRETDKPIPSITSTSSEVLYKWHLPDPRAYQVSSDNRGSVKSKTVVVLLGWLGAKQRHLKKYADWYTSRGYHAITFTFPMSDVVSFKVGGKAERELESLASHLASCVEEEGGNCLVFHTFSNTGWLTYGGILEKLRKRDPSSIDKIKGCVVDSAPVDAPDPQVWASGFSAAILKKNSVASKGSLSDTNKMRTDVMMISDSGSGLDPKPALTEAALLEVLEKFFEVILNIPSINRRLSDILDVLSSKQPNCPQLYIYSSADRVIPARSVESFIEKQRKAGHVVRSCNFVSSPHVDHFRNHPTLYTTQLTQFLEDCLLQDCPQEEKIILAS